MRSNYHVNDGVWKTHNCQYNSYWGSPNLIVLLFFSVHIQWLCQRTDIEGQCQHDIVKWCNSAN